MSSLKTTLVFKIDQARPNKKSISRCAAIIKKGGLVAFPTETVYGLAANMLKKKTLDRLYDVKKRPRNKPFTVHIASLDTIREMGCGITDAAKKLIDKFWPGPLTIILNSKDGKKMGFRMPANKVALELISASGVPLVAPSANLSGRPAPKDARTVLSQLGGKIDAILDGGRTKVGVESTVVDSTLTPLKILRKGAIRDRLILKAIYE